MSKKKKYRYKKIPLRDENKPEEAADKKASSADEQKGGHDTAIKKEKAEKQDASAKRRKDQFSVTIIGLIIYSFILIAIVTATYLGLKSFIRRNEAKQAEIEAARSEQAAEEEAGREDEKDAEETIDAEEDEPEDKEEDDHEAREHLADASDIITGDDNDVIDYEASLFEPAARNKDHKWVDRVFSRIENPKDPASAPVNSFEFSRRTAYLNNGNRIDLEIYKDPETGKITKITGTEYCGDNVEVIDYYYYDGDINYIAQSIRTVDNPIDISSSDIQSRYYFDHDFMARYVYCEKDKATEYSLTDMEDYSDGTREQYDYMEKSMLNRAYITYNAALKLPEYVFIRGYVMDEFNKTMDGYPVKIISETSGETVREDKTDGDGHYSIKLPVNEDESYSLEVSMESLNTERIYGITAKPGSLIYEADPIYMGYVSNAFPYNVQILVRDADDVNIGLSSASIKFRKGINNRDGEAFLTGVLDGSGAILAQLRSGDYTAEVSKGGYETSYFTVTVKPDHQAVLAYAVKDMEEDRYKAVLSWDTTPLDLDFRSFSSNAASVVKAPTDSIGSTMAEVINFTDIDRECYYAYISDYSDCIGGDMFSYNMSASNACVMIYGYDGLIASYHVPMGHAGVIWKPFEIRNKNVLPVNRYYTQSGQDSYWTEK